MKEETYEKVFIKTEADLPEENGKYICMIKNINHPALLQYDIQSKGEYGYSKQWLELVDWYLKPTEPVSDEDIFKSADLACCVCDEDEPEHTRIDIVMWEGYVKGAKAHRDNKIKKL